MVPLEWCSLVSTARPGGSAPASGRCGDSPRKLYVPSDQEDQDDRASRPTRRTAQGTTWDDQDDRDSRPTDGPVEARRHHKSDLASRLTGTTSTGLDSTTRTMGRPRQRLMGRWDDGTTTPTGPPARGSTVTTAPPGRDEQFEAPRHSQDDQDNRANRLTGRPAQGTTGRRHNGTMAPPGRPGRYDGITKDDRASRPTRRPARGNHGTTDRSQRGQCSTVASERATRIELACPAWEAPGLWSWLSVWLVHPSLRRLAD